MEILSVYRALPYEFWLRLLISDVLATAIVFVFSCILHNASVYDPYWSVQPPLILTLFALGSRLTLVRFLLVIAVWYWGIRLTANWAYTFYGLHCQDWRYTMLKEKTGHLYPLINFLGIHLFPTCGNVMRQTDDIVVPVFVSHAVHSGSPPFCYFGFIKVFPLP